MLTRISVLIPQIENLSPVFYSRFGNVVSWTVRKQRSVALSTADAEYVSLSLAACEGMWIRSLLNEINIRVSQFTLFEDNQSAIYISYGADNNKRTKHIDVRVHHVRDLIERGIIDVKFIESKNQKADMLTKNMSAENLQLGCRNLKLV